MRPATGWRFRVAPLLAGTLVTVLAVLLVLKTATIFLLLFVAVLISLYLGAAADVVHRRSGLPRQAALALAILATLGIVVGFIWLLVPPVVEQTHALLRVLPAYVESWEQGLDLALARIPGVQSLWQPGGHKVLTAVYQELTTYAGDVVPKLVGVIQVSIEAVSVAIMGIYLALHPGLYRELLIAIFPPVHRDLVRSVLADLSRALRAWIVGQLASMVLLGGLTAIGLELLGVPYWLTFGMFTGAVAIVPFFGTLVSTILPALFVLGGGGGAGRAVAVIGLGVVIHLIEGNIVGPKVMERQLQLPPVLIIMAVLIMGELLGPIGLVVAVPTLAVVDVLIRRILINRIYEGHGFRRLVRDSEFVVHAPAPAPDVVLAGPEPVDLLARAEAEGRRASA